MFRKVLVANRGEIAVRVIRACHEMNIEAVAVYSEADVDSLAVRLADEAYPIGPAPASQSYLNIARLVEVARQSGADAVHPGYGFLSENEAFARAVGEAGLTFIGPSPEAIQAMGVKAEARERMRRAGVPVIPGSEGPVRSVEEARRVAEQIGYPLLIKASAGGGGRGIRVVEEPSQLEPLLESAAREAVSGFGSGEVYLERLLRAPRHVEFQVVGDRLGEVVHLWERDSSLQRRRQKVVEEAPSPIVTAALRRRMGEAAVRAARAIGYHTAGTVEFLVDGNGDFYFIEMNTRIQVEHPTTEWITGLDLVKLQIRTAAGEPLGFAQGDVRPRGWSIEFRINVEDPRRNFIPSPGAITDYHEPGGPGVRVDSAAYVGYAVQPFYDSLLAKLVVWGNDREEALARAARALDEYRVEGVETTLEMHRALVGHPDFRAGRYHTQWLEGVFLPAFQRAPAVPR